MIRILLNNVQCTDSPKGVESLNETLELSRKQHGYIYQITGSITFIGTDYDFLRALYDADYCQDVDIDIQYSADGGNFWQSKVKGIIKLVGNNWDLIKRQVECPITDNSFLAKINNNRKTKFYLGGSKDIVLSKNGVDVTYKWIKNDAIQLFSPITGRLFNLESTYVKTDPPWDDGVGDTVNLIPPPRTGMLIWDALNLIIAIMSDDEVDFKSDHFAYSYTNPSTYNDEAWGVLMSGRQIRHGGGKYSGCPYISFEDLFNDLFKIFNVYFCMEVSAAGKPVFRVEPEYFFRQQNSEVYFNDVTSMVEGIDMGLIYSKIKLGCSKMESDFPIGDVHLVMHEQEEFPLDGTCNVDNTLDLQLTTLIINTNSIAKVLPPISGFNFGTQVINKWTNEDTAGGGGGGFNQHIVDSSGDFQEHRVGNGYLIYNPLTNRWTYVNGVFRNNNISIYDIILAVENLTYPATGYTKPYKIYEPANFSDYDDETFLIQINKNAGLGCSLTNMEALITALPFPNLYIYNTLYANYQVITRHLGGIAQSIVDTLTDVNDQFNSILTLDKIFDDTTLNTYMFSTIQDSYRRLRFNDDTSGPTYFDTNSNYDATTGIYTVPQEGYYHAECSVRVTNSVGTGDDYIQDVELVRISANGEGGDSAAGQTTILDGTSYTFNLDKIFYCSKGDRIEVWIKKRYDINFGNPYYLQYLPWSESASGYGSQANFSTFGVDALYNGGGLIPASTPDDARLFNFDSQLALTRSEMDGLITSPFKYYHTNYGITKYISAFIEKISRSILTGKTTMTKVRGKNLAATVIIPPPEHLPETLDFIARVQAQGDDVTGLLPDAWDQFFTDISTIRSKIGRLWVPLTDTFTGCPVPAINTFDGNNLRGNALNTLNSFIAGDWILGTLTPDGSTKYINDGYEIDSQPETSQYDFSYGVFTNDISNSNYIVEIVSYDTGYGRFRWVSTNAIFTGPNVFNGTANDSTYLTLTSAIGLQAMSRISDSERIVKSGSNNGTDTIPTSVTTGFEDYIFALNNTGVVGNYTTRPLRAYFKGKGLTLSELNLLEMALQTLFTNAGV